MSKEIDWSKAPEGATHYCPEADSGQWRDLSGEMGKYWSEMYRQWRDAPIKSNEFTWGKTYERPTQEWAGTGLPPVGTVCEFYDESSSVDWREGLENGDKVKILAHYSPLDDGDLVAVFCYEIEGGKLTDQAVADCFRPIRTQEQIAAEARKSAVNEMLTDAGVTGSAFVGDPEAEVWAAALYDAGYRKTEAGK